MLTASKYAIRDAQLGKCNLPDWFSVVGAKYSQCDTFIERFDIVRDGLKVSTNLEAKNSS